LKPLATYRIQLNREFDFYKLKAILLYLSKLGISHVYASPLVQARRGSTHGYDATDPNKINQELGGKNAFEDLTKEATALGLEWIQDIVPNHIAYSSEGTIVSDLLKYGLDSKYYTFLDVDWNHPSPKLNGKILAPFLNDEYSVCLRQGQIKLAYHNGFQILYGYTEFPIRISSYKKILAKVPQAASLANQDDNNLILTLLQHYNSDNALRTAIEAVVNHYNTDVELLKELLSNQIYVLSNWRNALKEINYRRFFAVADLICLRIEETNVFEEIHQLIQQLVSEKKMTGLRIDHIDGLYDPEQYLKRVRKLAPDAYIVVEKILLNSETLPSSWPVEGTTGYDFLNQLNGLFIATQNEEEISVMYSKFTKNRKSFDELTYKHKKRVIQRYFGGDIANLTRQLNQVLKRRPFGEKCSPQRTREAIVELISNFPIYRTYFSPNSEKNENHKNFEAALKSSKEKNRKINPELNAIDNLIQESPLSNDALQFIMRLQQFTVPIMAKGVEDTVFYVYNRLLSLNEVGSNPANFGGVLKDYHVWISSRQGSWPMSLNATSTHDTKRGEDCRARINVLSEIPSEFGFQIRKWSSINFKRKKNVANKLVPSKNEEYYIYQTFIGSFPFEGIELEEFKNRMKLHIIKALREAKTNSSWVSPNLPYEEAVSTFVTELLDSSNQNAFLQDFLPFQKRIAFCGFLNSLSQTLIKIASPGVPDFYQGTELWDLSLVDPDNRRPVDFIKRQRFLEEVQNLEPLEIQRLLEHFEDGKVKIYEISKALEIRNRHKDLFQSGAYVPLEVKGSFRNNLIAFCRRNETSCAVIIAPRFMAKLTNMEYIPLGDVWSDTFVCLPQGASKVWNEIFTEESVVSKRFGNDEGFYVGDLLQSFPVALLIQGKSKT
jgi:(1->4)-alpha-D-glucan 1-alpha-D-glucosylmutase